jgi:hypothetical protein
LFMTPGLAFFYGGMVRSKHVLSMPAQNFAVIAVVGIIWVLIGYTLAFGGDVGGGPPGSLHFAGFANPHDAIPGMHLTVRVRHLPDDVRRHHRRPAPRRGRRPNAISRFPDLCRALGHRRVRTPGPLGLLLDRLAGPGPRL